MSSLPAVAEKGEAETDPVERMIRSSGCWNEHVALCDCVGDEKDWRKCQQQVATLRECMQRSTTEQKQQTDWQKQHGK